MNEQSTIEARGRARWVGVAIAAAALAALLHLAETWFPSRALGMATKPIPVLAMIALTLRLGRPDAYRRWIAIGLALSVVGDVLLSLPGDFFVPGLVAFLLAHLGYVVAFRGGVPPLGRPPLAPARVIPFLIYGAVVGSQLWPGLGAMRIPVSIYMATILVMGWRSAARVGFAGERRAAQWAGLVGACLFIVSDSLIAVNQFHHALPLSHFWVMVTYWAGQTGIALSAERVPVHS